MLKNWKTSLAGLAMILGALADVTHSLSAGTPVSWNADSLAISGGIGLLLAKDSTTHSTVAEIQASTSKDLLAKDLAAAQTQAGPNPPQP